MARTENLTIMFTDVVGYTERTSAQSRAENKSMLRRCNQLMLPLVKRFGGWHIKSIGDALLIAFRSPTDGVRCGMALQDALAESNRGLPSEQHLHIRVAINVGEVLLENMDVYGEAVNVAARVEHITPADAIYFTEAVYLSMNKAEVPSKLIGTETLKGIPEPVKIYAVPPRHVTRLIPAHEGLDESPGELPYGGMHKISVELGSGARLKNRLRQAQFNTARSLEQVRAPQYDIGKNLAAVSLRTWGVICAIMVLAAAAGFIHYSSSSDEVSSTDTALVDDPVIVRTGVEAQDALLNQGDRLLADNKYAELKGLYEPRLQRNPRDAVALLYQGHVLFAQSKRSEGLSAYAKALSENPALNTSHRLARNLVNGLSWTSDQAIPLLKRYLAPAMVAELAQRSGQPGGQGRSRAIELLEQSGNKARVDRFGAALQDLHEASDCPAKLDAVKRLRPFHDRRALAELEKQTGGGLKGWLQNRCVRSEAQAAIDEIQRR